jgi:hypothetical protein
LEPFVTTLGNAYGTASFSQRIRTLNPGNSMKKTTQILILIFSALFPFPPFLSAGEILQDGDFAKSSKGEPPVKPWLVNKPVEGITVEIDEIEDVPEVKRWVHIKDTNPDQAAGIRYDFPAVASGRLTFKLYYKTIGSAFGVYLGDTKVSNWETRIIDMKILKKGVLSVADLAERLKTDFSFDEKKLYHLYIDFKPNKDKSGFEVEIGDVASGKKIYSHTTSVYRELQGLRIVTDSSDVETDVYVGDISLQD